MCDLPFLLVAVYKPDDKTERAYARYSQHAGEGQAEEAGREFLNTGEGESFRVYSLIGEYKFVSRIERVSLKSEIKA